MCFAIIMVATMCSNISIGLLQDDSIGGIDVKIFENTKGCFVELNSEAADFAAAVLGYQCI